MNNQKPIIGLLGGAGSGKSLVADRFEVLGCAVVRADLIVHGLLREAAVMGRVVEAFGQGVLDGDGQVDRTVLGEVVFSDVAALEKLNGLLHPLVAEEEKRLIAGFQGADNVKAVVLDVPLLLEVGQDKWCDALIYVVCDKEVREKRLVAGRGWSKKRIKNVEKSQISLDTKAKIAEYRLQNNSSISDLMFRADEILSQILEPKDFPHDPL